MHADTASALLPWLLAGLAFTLAGLGALIIRMRKLERLNDDLAGDIGSRLESLFGQQQLHFVRELQASNTRSGDRLMDLVAGETDRLRERLEAGEAASRHALQQFHLAFIAQFGKHQEQSALRLSELASAIGAGQEKLRSEMMAETLRTLSEHARADRELLQNGLKAASGQLSGSVEALQRTVGERLEAITGHVNQRLDEGFRKTNETFASVMARLATIDEAQKKIGDLTTNVVSLQELLGDKRARGAFGEVQLEALVRNALPPEAFDFQHVLPNGTRADCVLRLPEPTGMVVVDSKFPLENYHRMFAGEVGDLERRAAQNAFRNDVRRHVEAIAAKYILPDVTSDGAVMFIPAEAVFAEIHAYHPEVVAHAMTRRVWIVSPTTLMAVLNTARAVLKDVETRKQIHVIKDALGKLAKDFARFDERMQKLATHIRQAGEDVAEVQTSSRKISAHFARIEAARLDELPESLPGA
ncbi:DNA recombination protein RmuC [Zoogloea sp.]|uniref:DNA recombination protein RmuC n=1 Tax=Zoogloea sp. TaxID=49181 RepID=UPI0026121992|nr:DNA recombination protein RmuC [Zoogloea sp.]MDD3354062.1 DNA recombination protein RmuC [Zoogloea sp.]